MESYQIFILCYNVSVTLPHDLIDIIINGRKQGEIKAVLRFNSALSSLMF